jgi:hypothetical protein
MIRGTTCEYKKFTIDNLFEEHDIQFKGDVTTKLGNKTLCNICNIETSRTSMSKHLKSEKHIRNLLNKIKIYKCIECSLEIEYEALKDHLKLENDKHICEDLTRCTHINYHYVLIKDLSRLIRSQLTNDDHAFTYFCDQCLSFRGNDLDKYNRHMEDCSRIDSPVKCIMPKEGETLKYKNIQKQQEVPFIIVADIEAFLAACNIPSKSGSTIKNQSHKAFAFGYSVISRLEKSEDNTYRSYHEIFATEDEYNSGKPELRNPNGLYHNNSFGKRIIQELINKGNELYNNYYHQDKQKSILPLTADEKNSHRHATTCYLCFKKFVDPKSCDERHGNIVPSEPLKDDEVTDVTRCNGVTRASALTQFSVKSYKCKDHDHFRGNFRGTACKVCNLKYRTPDFIPVYFHNLESYDAHFLIKELGINDKEINIIAMKKN